MAAASEENLEKGFESHSDEASKPPVDTSEISISCTNQALGELIDINKDNIAKAHQMEIDDKKAAKVLKEKKAKKLEEDRKSGKLEKEMEKQVDPELNLYLKNDKNAEDMLGSLLKAI